MCLNKKPTYLDHFQKTCIVTSSNMILLIGSAFSDKCDGFHEEYLHKFTENSSKIKCLKINSHTSEIIYESLNKWLNDLFLIFTLKLNPFLANASITW